jgi:hypothetical protein
MLAAIIIIITIAFMVLEVAIWTGNLKIEALGNLNYGLDKILENPAFVGLLVTLIVGTVSGFMQNVFKKNDTFDLKKFAETFFFYVPLLTLIGQFLPVSYGAVLLFVIDAFRRVLLKLVPTADTGTTPTQPSTPTTPPTSPTPIVTYSAWIQSKDLFTGQPIWMRNVYHNGAAFTQEYSTTDPTVKITSPGA